MNGIAVTCVPSIYQIFNGLSFCRSRLVKWWRWNGLNIVTVVSQNCRYRLSAEWREYNISIKTSFLYTALGSLLSKELFFQETDSKNVSAPVDQISKLIERETDQFSDNHMCGNTLFLQCALLVWRKQYVVLIASKQKWRIRVTFFPLYNFHNFIMMFLVKI